MPDADVMRRMPVERAIGLAGIVGTVLLVAVVVVGSSGEPPLDATTAEAAHYLQSLDQWWIPPLRAIFHIATMLLLCFMAGLALLLRRAEGEVPVRSTIAMLSGALFAAYVILEPTEQAAVHRASELDQSQLALAYDVTHFGFVNVWLPMGTFALACGWLIVSTRALPRWLGWWGVLIGITLGLAQFFWTVGDSFLLLYYLWLLTTAGLLIRHGRRSSPDQDRTALTGSTT
ncbi:MAG TPA: DUF4386 family protein [Kineosporiaceae bacterium]|nr:DUF4386 family protein [Kineosporiaceae bacterium]